MVNHALQAEYAPLHWGDRRILVTKLKSNHNLLMTQSSYTIMP